jgi:hypothetical protein
VKEALCGRYGADIAVVVRLSPVAAVLRVLETCPGRKEVGGLHLWVAAHLGQQEGEEICPDRRDQGPLGVVETARGSAVVGRLGLAIVATYP